MYRICGYSVAGRLMLIAGSKDEVFKAERSEDAVRPHNSGEVVIIDGAKHDNVLTDPRTLAAVKRFVESRVRVVVRHESDRGRELGKRGGHS